MNKEKSLQVELKLENQKEINKELYDIYDDLKGIYNIGYNSLEYLSALIYVFYENKEQFKLIFEEKKDYFRYAIEIINDKLNNIRHNNEDKKLFFNIQLNKIIARDEEEYMWNILTKLNQLILKTDKLYNNGKKVLAEAYEYVIMMSANENANNLKKEEFYTPKGVVKTMVNLLDIRKGKTVYNPACNSGEFLVEMSKKADIFAFGEETNITNYNICNTNLWLHDIKNKKISNEYTKRNDWNSLKFDIAIGNPPFSVSNANNDILNNKINRYHYLFQNSTSYTKFLSIMIENLNDYGQMAIILPHGFLFKDTFSEKIMRKKLIESKCIDAIIGLPEKLFPGTKIPVIILVIKINKHNEDVLFIDASREYKKKRKTNILTIENQQKIINTYRNRIVEDEYSCIISNKEIEQNEYNLNISEYIKPETKKQITNKNEILHNILKLEKEKKEIEEKLMNIIKH